MAKKSSSTKTKYSQKKGGTRPSLAKVPLVRAPVVRTHNTARTLAWIGILSAIISVGIFPWLFGFIALVLGVVALVLAHKHGDHKTQQLAILTIVLSILLYLLAILLQLLY